MDDEQLGRKIYGAVWDDANTLVNERARKLGAAARAALTGSVTEAEVRTWHQALTGERDSSAVLDILAALRHFARVPGKVPSVEEIEKHMCGIECARVAHDMMQRLVSAALGQPPHQGYHP